MAKPHKSVKQQELLKANTSMVVIIAVSAFLVVFAIIASRALWVRMSYQNRVISAKEQARDQLRSNLDTVDELVKSYQVFVDTPDNVLGGSSEGNGDKDGDNAKIVLDALPSKYDFPGLTTSLEKIVKDNGNSIEGISGQDEEINQSDNTKDSSNPIDMPFELTAGGNFSSISKLLSLFDRSIRPIHIQQLKLSGSNSELELTISAKSYYQPARTLEPQTKVVK